MTTFSLRLGLVRFSRKAAWIPLLVFRFTLGAVFLSSGWGKLHHLSKVASFFNELGIPAPSFNASLVAGCELVCGALLLMGLLSRLATIPLMVTMIVALATAKHGDIHGLSDLLGLIEFTYLCMLFAIAIVGPGAASLDGLIARTAELRRGVRVLSEPALTGDRAHASAAS